MEKNSILGLSKQLETKKQQERERIEAEIQAELGRLVENLKAGLNNDLNTTRNDITGQLNQIAGLISDLEISTKTKATTTQKNLETSLSGLETASKNRNQKTWKALTEDLKAIERASSQHRQAAIKNLKWGWLKYSLPALLICATFLAANWGLMQWQSSRLTSMQEQIERASQTLNQLPQGVQFYQDEAGVSYLIYDTKPEHYQTTSGSWVSKLKKP